MFAVQLEHGVGYAVSQWIHTFANMFLCLHIKEIVSISDNNNNADDDDDDDTERRKSRFLQSLHCASNCFPVDPHFRQYVSMYAHKGNSFI